MLPKELFEQVKACDAEAHLDLVRWLLAGTEPEIDEGPTPVLKWPPFRPPVPTYEGLPRVYTENYYTSKIAIEFQDPEMGDFTLPEGSRLMFLGYSRWSKKTGWEMHMYTLDKFPVLETYAGAAGATERRMEFLTEAQLCVLHEELSSEDEERLSDLLSDDDRAPQEFHELADLTP